VRNWLLFFHVLGAIMWLGGSIYIESLMAGASRTKEQRTVVRTAQRVIDANRVIMLVGPLLVLVFGIWLVIELHGVRGFEKFWILGAFVLAGAAFAANLFYFRPKTQEFNALVAERGMEDEAVAKVGGQIGVASHLTTLAEFLTLVLMIFKPTF